MPTVLRTGSKAATADTSLFRMVSLNASKFPMKSRRGTILSKRTRIKKTDNSAASHCHAEATSAAARAVHDFA